MAIEFLTNYEWVEIDRPIDVEIFFTTAATIPDMQKVIHVRRRVVV